MIFELNEKKHITYNGDVLSSGIFLNMNNNDIVIVLEKKGKKETIFNIFKLNTIEISDVDDWVYDSESDIVGYTDINLDDVTLVEYVLGLRILSIDILK